MNNKTLTVPFEIKDVDDQGKFTGYGSVFDVEDCYSEVVRAGAFKKSLAAHRKRGVLPKLLWQHRGDSIIGKYTKMKEDGYGLAVEGQLYIDEIEKAREAFFLMKEKQLDGLSIGFMSKKTSYDKEKQIRYLDEVDLWEVSLVTFPANGASRVMGAKAADEIEDVRAFERFLVENGYTKQAAKSIASGGYKSRSQLRDEGGKSVAEPCDAAVKAVSGEISKLLTALR